MKTINAILKENPENRIMKPSSYSIPEIVQFLDGNKEKGCQKWFDHGEKMRNKQLWLCT